VVAAVYVADDEQDALVPLMLAYSASCALELLDGKEQSDSCQRAIKHELDGTRMRPPMARAHQALWRFAEPVLNSRRWRVGRRLTLVFLWRPHYDGQFVGMNGLEVVQPHVIVAGAIGTHVPCWSDGKAGGKCPIEAVSEKMHRKFWQGMRKMVKHSSNLRLLAWLGVPFGHTAGRYSNGNYSAFNSRAKKELMAIGRETSGTQVRAVDFAALVKRPGLFRVGVLARRDDNTHFQCIARGPFFYPAPEIVEAKTHKVLLEDADGRPAPVGGKCGGKSFRCTPNLSDGCADPVNLAVVRTLLMLVATRERRERTLGTMRANRLGVVG
jgi:hypothetical protein